MIGRRAKLLAMLAAVAAMAVVPAATAAIFGANDLDRLTRAGTPNQCYLKGAAALPVGRIYITGNGDRQTAGSGAVVGSSNIVVTAGHLFETGSSNRLRPGAGVSFAIWEGTPANCRLVDHPADLVLVGTQHPVQQPSRDYAVLRLRNPVTAYAPLKLGSPGGAGAARAGGRITVAGFAGHRSTHLGRDLSVVTCRGYAMPVWDPQWTIADSLIVFDCDTATGMSGSPILMGRTLVGIATASMNLSEGNPFNLTDNFIFGYALEPSLGRAIACVKAGGCEGFDVRDLE
jgi:hypothetical protein